MRHDAGLGKSACRRSGLLRLIEMKSRPTVLAAMVLSLALLGDSLLYAALPLNSTTFGISVAWAGVLLSANRIVRLFVYPLLPHIVDLVGFRSFTIAGAALGAFSTLAFAVASGPWALLGARIVWGIVFGALSLATLAYATHSADGAGARVGVSLSLRELGPIVSLTAGALLATAAGIRSALIVLGAISLLAVPTAFALPRSIQAKPDRSIAQNQPSATVHRHGVLSAMMGFVADGLFPATIALLLIESQNAAAAVIAAGTLLALKRAVVVIVGPLSGHAADRFGARAITILGFIVMAQGTILIACGNVFVGAIVLVSGAAVTSSSIPLLADSGDTRERLSSLARLGLARDVGAAVGPLVAPALFQAIGGSLLYAGATILLAATALTARPAAMSRTACGAVSAPQPRGRMRICRAHASDRQ
jgi:MFS transporter, DHA1 family, inner membrane transport protein